MSQKKNFSPITCAVCGRTVEKTGGTQKYCPECRREKDREASRKYRVVNLEKRREGCREYQRKRREDPINQLLDILQMMIQRCGNPQCKDFRDYGMRGIRLCSEWKSDPMAFVRWALEQGWEQGMHVDRINGYLGYSPENCRIVTPLQNGRNRRGVKLTEEVVLEARKRYAEGGVTQAQLARQYKVTKSTLRNALTGKTWYDVDGPLHQPKAA